MEKGKKKENKKNKAEDDNNVILACAGCGRWRKVKYVEGKFFGKCCRP